MAVPSRVDGPLANLGLDDATCANVGKSWLRSGYLPEPTVAWMREAGALLRSGRFGQESMTRAVPRKATGPSLLRQLLRRFPIEVRFNLSYSSVAPPRTRKNRHL